MASHSRVKLIWALNQRIFITYCMLKRVEYLRGNVFIAIIPASTWHRVNVRRRFDVVLTSYHLTSCAGRDTSNNEYNFPRLLCLAVAVTLSKIFLYSDSYLPKEADRCHCTKIKSVLEVHLILSKLNFADERNALAHKHISSPIANCLYMEISLDMNSSWNTFSICFCF